MQNKLFSSDFPTVVKLKDYFLVVISCFKIAFMTERGEGTATHGLNMSAS